MPSDASPLAPPPARPVRAPDAVAPPAPAWSGYALALGGSVLFATKGILAKFAYEAGVDVETLLAWRMGIAVPVFIAVALLARRRNTTDAAPALTLSLILRLSGIGLLGYWYSSYADFLGLTTVTPQFERLILFTYPLFVVLFGALLFRQPIRLSALLAFAVSYAGLALVFTQDFSLGGRAVLAGALWVFSAAVTFALYQLLAKEMIMRLGTTLFTALAMSAATLGVFAQFLLTHPLSALAVPPNAVAWLVAIALGATVAPTFLMNAGLSRISAQANALIGTLSPIATLGLAVLFLKERATLIDLAGCLLVVAGIGAFTLLERRRRAAAQP